MTACFRPEWFDPPVRAEHFVYRALRVPVAVWHAIYTPCGTESAYIVVNDKPYHYESPEDWILPPGSDAIP